VAKRVFVVEVTLNKRYQCRLITPSFLFAQISRGEKRVDADTNESGYHYYVHFIGWNKEYDRWLEESQILKYDVALLTGGTSAAADEARRKAAEVAEAKKQKERLAEIPACLRLRIPPLLKKVALDDHEQIVQNGLYLPLPRNKHSRPSVSLIIKEWQETRRDEDNDEQQNAEIDEVASGLLSYFNLSLRHLLLYTCEVPLCDETLGEGTMPADVYGAEHLIRLMVKLPELVPIAIMTRDRNAALVVALEDHLMDLMGMMSEAAVQARIFSCKEEYTSNPYFLPPLSRLLQDQQTTAGDSLRVDRDREGVEQKQQIVNDAAPAAAGEEGEEEVSREVIV
jgi:mortality factor 4-like protein 1